MEKINLENIRQIDLRELALSLGFERDSVDKKVFRRDYLKVHIDENKGRFNSFINPEIHGIGAIDFVIKVENMDFKEAIAYLSGQTQKNIFFPTRKEKKVMFENDEKKLIMPIKDNDNQKILNYLLLERKLDKTIIENLIRHFKIYQDVKGNTVFVCSDICGKLTGAEIKSKNFHGMAYGSKRLCGSFYIKSKSPIKTIVITESAIDCISYAILNKLPNTIYISISGVVSSPTEFIQSCLKKFEIEKIIIGYDNDIAGQKFANDLKLNFLLEKNFKGVIEIEKPSKKDWNDDLKEQINLKILRSIYSVFRNDIESIYNTKTNKFLWKKNSL